MKYLLSLFLSLIVCCTLCPAYAGQVQFDLLEESLQQTYPFDSQQIILRLFSQGGDITNLKVGIAEIKDPDGKSLPPEDITATDDNQGKVTDAGTKVTLTIVKPQDFARSGAYKIFLRLRGSTTVGCTSAAVPMLAKTLTLNRPVAEINLEELKDRTIDLYKVPFGSASQTVNYFLFETSGKSEIADLVPYGQEIYVSNTKVLAPGEVTIAVVNPPGQDQPDKTTRPADRQKGNPVSTSQQGNKTRNRIQLQIDWSKLTWSGTFVTNLVLYSPSFGGRKLIPVNLRVSDYWPFALLVIFLGVWGGYFTSTRSKRWLPHQKNDYRIVKLRGDLDRLYAVAILPENRKKLYSLIEKLDDAREKNEAGEVDAAETQIRRVEDDLKTFREQRAAEAGKTQNGAQKLRNQVQEYLHFPEAKEEARLILVAISGVENHLSIDEVDQAGEALQACQKDFDELRQKYFRGQLDSCKKAIVGRPAGDPAVEEIKKLIKAIDDALDQNQLDQVPAKLNGLQRDIAALPPQPGAKARKRALPLLNDEEIAAAAKSIKISPVPEDRSVNTKIFFKVKVPDGTVKPDNLFQWSFGDGSSVTEATGEVTHRFTRASNYQVECSILRDGTVEETLPSVTVMILGGLTEKALTEILSKIRLNDRILSGIALFLASLTGVMALYVNKPFGSLENYILAFIWGFGIDNTVRGFSTVLKKITE